MSAILVMFTRYPIPGKTKTRLIPALGPERAAEVQRQMTERTVDEMVKASASCKFTAEIRFSGGSRTDMTEWLGSDFEYRDQGEGDLGVRLSKAFTENFDAGADRVIVIGSDCPDVTARILVESLSRLDESDVVLGPAADGGYYLIGMRRRHIWLFEGIPWGTARVRAMTIGKLEENGIAYALLEQLSDIDTPEDLKTDSLLQDINNLRTDC